MTNALASNLKGHTAATLDCIGRRISAERLRRGIKLRSRKGVSRGDVSEPYQSVHQRKLSRVVQFQAGNPFATGKHGGFSQRTQLPSVDKGFQDVLLDGEIIVADGRQLISELGQVFDRLLDPIVGDVIGRCFSAQTQVIADILLEEALSIMTTDHWVRELHVLDDGLAAFPCIAW